MKAAGNRSCCEGKSATRRPRKEDRESVRIYDPLRERIALIQRLCDEYDQWSRLARDQDKSDPYVAKILALLKESLKDTEALLERLGLLDPRQDTPRVAIDLSLIHQQVGNPDELVDLVGRLSRELEALAEPVSLDDAGKLQPEEGEDRAGSGPVAQLLQRGAYQPSTGEDP